MVSMNFYIFGSLFIINLLVDKSNIWYIIYNYMKNNKYIKPNQKKKLMDFQELVAMIEDAHNKPPTGKKISPHMQYQCPVIFNNQIKTESFSIGDKSFDYVKTYASKRELEFIKNFSGLGDLCYIEEVDGQTSLKVKSGMRTMKYVIKKDDDYYIFYCYGVTYELDDLRELACLIRAAYQISLIPQDYKNISDYIDFIKKIDEKIGDDIIYMFANYIKMAANTAAPKFRQTDVYLAFINNMNIKIDDKTVQMIIDHIDEQLEEEYLSKYDVRSIVKNLVNRVDGIK